jgi:patatin-related protein
MTTASQPKVEYTKEVRFAVVMYGGVSLAIYINGVAQELLRLVRATADPDPNANLTGSEKVYRKLSRVIAEEEYGEVFASPAGDAGGDQAGPAPTRFVVDIISGSSAGGINGVFLAKALANGQDMDDLQTLWIEQGEIQRLINDEKSLEFPLVRQDPPASLLNSQRMYVELLKALMGMDKKAPRRQPSPYIDELDLFVTSTDMSGVTSPLRLADSVVCERRHRNVTRFIYSTIKVSGERERNDFKDCYNPFLAYAARATSAFPFAFEPMRLDDIDSIVERMPEYQANADDYKSTSPCWTKFYKDYSAMVGPGNLKFPQRSFNDGGVLDNKPFSYATEALANRHADVPVDRKLIYIEPSPEHPELYFEQTDRPNAIENVKAALSLPRDETIREDLQRILDRNRLILRANRIMEGLELDAEIATDEASETIDGSQPRDESEVEKQKIEKWKVLGAMAGHPPSNELWAQDFLSEDEWAKLDLTDMVKRKGQSYVAYHRLEIAEVTDELATLLARLSHLDGESDFFIIIRGLIRAWRDLAYVEHQKTGDSKPTMNEFLVGFGFSYPLRRLNFLRTRIDNLYRVDKRARRNFESYGKASWAADDLRCAQERSNLRAALIDAKKRLNATYVGLRQAGRLIRSRPASETDCRCEREAAAADSQPTPSQTPAQNPVIDKVRAAVTAVIEAAAKEVGSQATGEALLKYFLGGGDATDPNQLSVAERRRLANSRIDDQCAEAAAKLLQENPGVALALTAAADEIRDRVTVAREAAERNALEFLQAGAASPADDAVRKTLLHYYERYDDYDMVTFPLFYETDFGESDVIEVLRVSPEDAKALVDESTTGCRKLAGTAVGHFGAFLNELWRKNDILWGRLDGAERLISALLPNHPRTRGLIGEAQAEILNETLAHLGPDQIHDLLVESFMRTRSGKPDQEAAQALTTYLTNLKSNCPEPLRTLLSEKINDATVQDYYQRVFKVRSKLEPELTVRTLGRATTVIGKVLSGVSDDYAAKAKSSAPVAAIQGYLGAWLVRFGVVFTGLVEVAIPQTIPHLFFRHLLKLLYLFEVLLVVSGTIFGKPQMTQLGWTALGVTAAINAVVWWLRDFMAGRTSVQTFLGSLGASFVAILILVGALKVASVLFKLQALSWLHNKWTQFSSAMSSVLTPSIWNPTVKLIPLALALGVIVMLWRRSRTT